jgi:FlgD Ig-like domain
VLSAVYGGNPSLLPSIGPAASSHVVLSASPTLTTVNDVTGDHGRMVRLRFAASPFDYWGSGTPITGYEVYRKASQVPFAALSPGAPSPNMAPIAKTRPAPSGIALDGWDYLVTTPAHDEGIYQVDAATVTDSSSLGSHLTTYFVRAATSNVGTFYDSAPDSGFSVDNLALSAPSPFTAAYAAGATHLHWGASAESDFWYYNLYRGSSAAFIPSPVNRIASQSDTGFVDLGQSGSYYKLAAANLSGIESGYALVTPSATSAVGGVRLPATVFLAAPSPNPAHDATSFAFGLPHDAEVSLVIYDVDGRSVRSMSRGAVAAGEHRFDWDLRDSAGAPVRGGVYFVRMAAGGITRSARVAVVR